MIKTLNKFFGKRKGKGKGKEQNKEKGFFLVVKNPYAAISEADRLGGTVEESKLGGKKVWIVKA